MFSVIFRTSFMFILVIIVMRIMGKKSLGEFGPSDLVSTILISNFTSLVIETPNLPLLYSIIPILLVMCFEVISSVCIKKSSKIYKLTQGSAQILILNGIINQNTMNKLRFCIADILEAMRSKDIFYLEEVSLAIVETTGVVNIYKNPKINEEIKKSKLPPLAVISDGEYSEFYLKTLNVDKSYIDRILLQNKYHLKDVLLLVLDGDMNYNIVLKEV